MFVPNDQYLSYYQYKDICSYSKFDLIKPGYGENRAIYDETYYHFYDESFKAISWKEPTETIDNLYKLRAQELRDKYSKLALEVCNIDGFNTLVSFIKHNIKVDEVFFYYSSLDDISQYSKELEVSIYPKIKELQNHFNFFFRGIECGEYYKEKMWDDTTKTLLSWLENGPWTGNSLIHKHLLELVPEYDINGLGVIYSNGKPFVFPKENAFRFCDILNPIDFIKDYCKYDSEDFYWYPGSKIVVKQAHMVKQWADKHKNYMNMLPTVDQIDEEYVPLRLTNRVIYPDIKENMFPYNAMSVRSKYDIRARCSYSQLFASPQSWLHWHGHSIANEITNNMKYLQKTVHKSWMKTYDIYDGLKPVWSRLYILE
jgi:hypothetical protein